MALHGQGTQAIYLQPPAELVFEIPVGQRGQLATAVAIHPEAWHQSLAGGCEFHLKIDGRFIKDLHQDTGNQIFVRALRDVGHALAKQIIAEWVESAETARLLDEMGIQYGQGFHFQAPRLLAAQAPEDVAVRAAER